jgi:hypothetical protein
VDARVRTSSVADRGGSIAHELFDPPGCLNGVGVLALARRSRPRASADFVLRPIQSAPGVWSARKYARCCRRQSSQRLPGSSSSSCLASARAAADAAEAALTLHRAEPRQAGELAFAAADAASSISAVVEAAAARELAGRALAEAGATGRAIVELRRAAGEFDQCGAPRRAAAVERRLRALGDRGRHRRSRPGTGTAGMDSLTGRELQVARLIVDRRTNSEIAQSCSSAARRWRPTSATRSTSSTSRPGSRSPGRSSGTSARDPRPESGSLRRPLAQGIAPM